MKEKNPLDFLLSQIGDLLLQIQEHKGPISQNLTPEVFLQLEELEKFMQQFQELNQKVYQASQINMEHLRTEALKSNQLNAREKSLLDRTKQLEKDAKNLQRHYSMIANQAKTDTKSTHRRNAQKARQKKFKQMGGSKGWIPL